MADTPQGSTVGDLIDSRYELLSGLGSGAFGEVWRAFDRNRGHEVALKLMEATAEDDAWAEATMLTRLESPNILRVNKAALAIDVPYLDTALAESGTAADLAGSNGLAPAAAVRVMRGLLCGLGVVHEHRILHRDIKPSNVFMTRTGDAQLGDFGVAAPMEADGTASVHGDPNIRPPEAFDRGGGRSSVASDIYGAGLTFYALLAGWLPFDFWSDPAWSEPIAQVRAGARDIRDVVPHVSLSLAKVLRKAIALEPDDRWQSAAAFDRALGRLPVLACDVTQQGPHAGHERCWRVRRRRDSHEFDVCVAVSGVTAAQLPSRLRTAFERFH